MSAPSEEAAVALVPRLQLYTAQYRTRDRDRLDITRGGCDRALADGKPAPGILFAPSKELLRRGLADRAAAKGDPARERQVWERYAAEYRIEMLDSYKRHRAAWEGFLRRERLVLVCFCAGADAAAQRCHRFLLARFWASPKLGALAAQYQGELREEDCIAPPTTEEAPPDILFGHSSGRSTRFIMTDGSGAGGIVTHDKTRRRKCRSCGKPASLLCDHPKGQKTCDAPICGGCARVVGEDLHHCPKHDAAEQMAVPGC